MALQLVLMPSGMEQCAPGITQLNCNRHPGRAACRQERDASDRPSSTITSKSYEPETLHHIPVLSFEATLFLRSEAPEMAMLVAKRSRAERC